MTPREAMALSKLDAQKALVKKRLAEIVAQEAKLAAKIKIQAGKEKRRLENKKKILLGAYLLDQMERSAESTQRVLKGLDKFLTRPADRAVFELSAAQVPSSAAAPATSSSEAVQES